MHLYMVGYMCINIKYNESFGFCVFLILSPLFGTNQISQASRI